MKYLSLFSGIAGFELGIQQAYERLQNLSDAEKQQHEATDTRSEDGLDALSASRLGNPVCVGYSEIDKYATQIYSKHFNHTNYGDITKIDADSLPDFDLLCGGFPCQSFSIAGKRGGFSDTRGTLFFEIARILKAKQPRLCLLENVKGLLSHDQGKTFLTIIATLDELGYDLQWQVLNSKNFGVPQNRERVFIVGHLRGTPRPEVFPFGSSNEVNTKQDGQRDDVAYCLQAGGDKHRGSYIVDKNKDGNLYKYFEFTPPIRTAPTNYNMSLHGAGAIRRLTPTECERLQGFPDGWTQIGAEIYSEGVLTQGKHVLISDTQRYKCLGNAVTVNVIQAIMEKLLQSPSQAR